jgi:3-hydroxypropanoate dehydrogenase
MFNDLDEAPMTSALDDSSLDQIFRSARTPNGWRNRPVEEDKVRQIYDLMKWGPTSANSSPARFVWVREVMQKYFAAPGVAEVTAMRNGSLQGAYLIIAARALGLDCGPMSGFDNAGVGA